MNLMIFFPLRLLDVWSTEVDFKNNAKALKKFLIEEFSLDRNVFLTIIES